jgi:hypothetical protein
MLGRTPGNIVAIKPMKDGVIADFKVTEKMLNYFIQKAHNRKMLVHPRIVIGVPSEITQVEKRAVMDSAYRAKASEVHLVEQRWWPQLARVSRLLNLQETWWLISAAAPQTSQSFLERHRLFAFRAYGRKSNGRSHHELSEAEI